MVTLRSSQLLWTVSELVHENIRKTFFSPQNSEKNINLNNYLLVRIWDNLPINGELMH